MTELRLHALGVAPGGRDFAMMRKGAAVDHVMFDNDMMRFEDMDESADAVQEIEGQSQEVSLRTEFPETWLWSEVISGYSMILCSFELFRCFGSGRNCMIPCPPPPPPTLPAR